jgi:hypothetical protein
MKVISDVPDVCDAWRTTGGWISSTALAMGFRSLEPGKAPGLCVGSDGASKMVWANFLS